MKNLFKKLIRSLYCVNIPCAVCGEPMPVKVWHSFRSADTYFCKECANDFCRQMNNK